MPSAATQTMIEADDNYIGFNSRLDPSNLPPGIAQYAQNVRMQRGAVQPRKGTKRLTQTELNSLTMVGSGLYQNASGQDNVVLVFTDRMFLYNTETQLLIGPFTFPSGRGILQDGVCDVVQALDKIYIFRGQYTDPELASTISNSQISSGSTGTITVTTQSPHLYSTGDEVSFWFGTHDNTDSSADGNYIITVTSPTQFTFTFVNNSGVNFQAHSNVSGYIVRRGKPPLIWSGSVVAFAQQKYLVPSSGTALSKILIAPPPGDFGFYFQNRIVVKFSDDQLAVSDILSEEFDMNLNNFKINQGGNDRIVGVLPWVQDQFLVFMQKSIYIAFIETTSFVTSTAPGANSTITVVTTQVGCLARRTIVSAGQFVFFLSGKGVHMLTPQLDLKLVGQTLPLSEPVDDFFDQVNFDSASKSVAVYYDNRFFISLPVEDSSRNNRTLVYNTLNRQWESIDVYPSVTENNITYTMYQDDWQVCQYQGKRRLFLLTRFTGLTGYGGIFLTEDEEDGDEFKSLNGNPVIPFVLPAQIVSLDGQRVPIDARIRTREYTFQSLQMKRLSRGEYQFNNSPGDIVTINVRTHDPDTIETVITYEFGGSSIHDSTLRPRIALRGAAVDVETVFVKGRPSLKSGVIYAIVTNRNMETQE